MPHHVTGIVEHRNDDGPSTGDDAVARTTKGSTRDRVGVYLWSAFGVVAVLHGAVVLARLVIDGHPWRAVLFDGPGLFRLGTLLMLGSAATLSRRRHLTPRTLAVLDGSAALVVSLLGAIWVVEDPAHGHPASSLMMLVMLLLVVRAALVPSSWRRTLSVGLVTLAPVLVAAPASIPADVMMRDVPLRQIVAVVTTSFAVATLAVTVLTSVVIYRLRDRIRHARQLGPYRLGVELGQGGMGTVYEARHVLMPRPVALKLVRPHLSSPRGLARFEQEAASIGQLSHPNIVALHEYGETVEGMRYVAMELVEGCSLDRMLVRDGALPVDRALGILRQIAAALAHAHARGVVHRDIKPENIMLTQREGHRDLVKVLDFGLAQSMDGEDDDDDTLVGTPMFMAPEIILGDAVGSEADIYAIGALGYALLTGECLFAEHEAHRHRLLRAHLQQPVVPPSLRRRQEIPRDLEDVILRCLRKKPDERPRDGAELYDALTACEEPWSAKTSGERLSTRPAARLDLQPTGPVPLVQRARATVGS